MNNVLIAGVDIGGSHITASVVDMTNGSLVADSWHRREVNSRGSAAGIINEWAQVIQNSFVAGHKHPPKIGIAMPGPLDYEKGICLIKDQHKYDKLYGLNIKELLAAELGYSTDDIILSNDAECFLRGEVYAGAAKGYQRVVGITLGTGLGSSIYHNGKTLDADLWSQPFKNSIAEDYLSTRWFVSRYRELSGKELLHVKDIVEQGEPKLTGILFNEFGHHLAEFLLPLVTKEKAEAVVLGGNISLVHCLFRQELDAFFQLYNKEVYITTATLGERAALIGAASACRQEVAA